MQWQKDGANLKGAWLWRLKNILKEDPSGSSISQYAEAMKCALLKYKT